MAPAKDGRLLRPHPTSRAAVCRAGDRVRSARIEGGRALVHDISLNHYTWLARRRARACVDARRFVELAALRQSPELEREEATRCCCCGCVLGGSSCPSPTLPTFGVRHELCA
ncbi:hypothetical protein TRIUR3_27766 [Triticum urartu]|uniref:Uncharacterized protein n=1 Tax=Triticum urartu TaxID=4572 RepID=M7Z695_TRIUA|nr:hypothetical protein TRIUR3_27766 [Triticum urartu]